MILCNRVPNPSFLVWMGVLLQALGGLSVGAQNLAALLSERPTNSTFSITAYDSQTQQWGIAVATNNIHVGNSTIYIQPGVGAISAIAETEPDYGINGLANLKKGLSVKESLELTRRQDELADYRQVAVVDSQGNAYAFTGHSLSYWKGYAGHQLGQHYVVMGNQLADSVLSAMAHRFERTKGSLATRLLASLVAGQQAGGQINGKQSAALVVKSVGQPWYNQIDLRVDHSASPFADLQRLLNYHDGRQRLNQAIQRLRSGDRAKGLALLQQADSLVSGWVGLYNRLASAYILADEEEKTLSLIEQALRQEPGWRENIPAFYYLRKHAIYQQWVNESTFTEKDWSAAIQHSLNLGKANDALRVAQQVVKRYAHNSYLVYLLGKAHAANQDPVQARSSYQEALRLDPENKDAQRAFEANN